MKDGTFTTDRLLALYDRVADAEDAIPRLRRFVLDLAVRGKLVEQDANDEPAAELLKRIETEKVRLVKAGEIRKPKTLPPVDVLDVHIDMPIGWRFARVGELSTVITKGSTPTSYGHAYTVTGVNFIKVESIQKGRIAPDTITSFISEETNDFLSRSKLREGDLLFSIAGTIGTCALVTAEVLPANTNQALAIIRGTGLVFEADFLIIALRSFVSNAIQDKARGGAMNNVSLDDIQNLVVPLPPIAEQQRIVAKVDELMALCDQLEQARSGREAVRDRLTTASLTRLTAPDTDAETFHSHARFALQSLPTLTTRPHQIKTLRHTILNLAVRGKLVAQDLAEEPGADLLRRIRHKKNADVGSVEARRSEKFSVSEEDLPFKLPKNWSVAALRELSYNLGDGLHGTPEYITVGDIYFINGTNLRDGRIEVFPNTKKVSQDELAKHAKPLNHRTFLVSINGTLTNYAFYKGERVVLGKSACYFEISPLVDMQFIRVIVQSPYYIKYAFEKATGATISNLSLKAMNSLPIPLPPLAEQHRIVTKVDALMTLCDQLEASLTTTATTRSKLLEALLYEALNGALGSLPEAAA